MCPLRYVALHLRPGARIALFLMNISPHQYVLDNSGTCPYHPLRLLTKYFPVTPVCAARSGTYRRNIPFNMARWQSGHAADCNSVYAGSIPTRASIKTAQNEGAETTSPSTGLGPHQGLINGAILKLPIRWAVCLPNRCLPPSDQSSGFFSLLS